MSLYNIVIRLVSQCVRFVLSFSRKSVNSLMMLQVFSQEKTLKGPEYCKTPQVSAA